MLPKLHFKLAEVAADWSQLAGCVITENDILSIAADSLLPYVLLNQGVNLTYVQELQHPTLSLHFFTSSPIPIESENDQIAGEFIGRLFVDADQISKVIKNGFIKIFVGYDTDTMRVFYFVNPVKVYKRDLILTAENKMQFEARYFGVQHD